MRPVIVRATSVFHVADQRLGDQAEAFGELTSCLELGTDQQPAGRGEPENVQGVWSVMVNEASYWPRPGVA
ncbi:hypothetical protein ACFWOJ_17555 [Streptomyces sp. NPDC058439]|uniref:hypothetical protein n=1 Tax=Streptomyces sp. NPDC058439 TaxID=3346500 RepID=UPI00365D8600